MKIFSRVLPIFGNLEKGKGRVKVFLFQNKVENFFEDNLIFEQFFFIFVTFLLFCSVIQR